MAKIVSMKKSREESWVGSLGELNLVLSHRKELMYKLPIMSEEITRLDLWLLEQPKLPLRVAIEIWSRCVFCEWVFYGDASPELKHLILLRLRECYREFQKLPQHWQEQLSPKWDRWAAEFLDEEMEEAASGTA